MPPHSSHAGQIQEDAGRQTQRRGQPEPRTEMDPAERGRRRRVLRRRRQHLRRQAVQRGRYTIKKKKSRSINTDRND